MSKDFSNCCLGINWLFVVSIHINPCPGEVFHTWVCETGAAPPPLNPGPVPGTCTGRPHWCGTDTTDHQSPCCNKSSFDTHHTIVSLWETTSALCACVCVHGCVWLLRQRERTEKKKQKKKHVETKSGEKHTSFTMSVHKRALLSYLVNLVNESNCCYFRYEFRTTDLLL